MCSDATGDRGRLAVDERMRLVTGDGWRSTHDENWRLVTGGIRSSISLQRRFHGAEAQCRTKALNGLLKIWGRWQFAVSLWRMCYKADNKQASVLFVYIDSSTFQGHKRLFVSICFSGFPGFHGPRGWQFCNISFVVLAIKTAAHDENWLRWRRTGRWCWR